MKTTVNYIKIALADDHKLLRNALASLINGFGDCKVIHESGTGKELIKKINTGDVPDVILLDLNMPEMDGQETAEWLQKNYPEVHVLMLTMYDGDIALIQLVKAGVKGFLKKDVHPDELRFALHSVMESGYYYSSHAAGKLMNLFRTGRESNNSIRDSDLSVPEIEFLKNICTDLTYKEIAGIMKLNPRSVETLRDHLFEKLNVKSRVGLAMVAIRNGLVRL